MAKLNIKIELFCLGSKSSSQSRCWAAAYALGRNERRSPISINSLIVIKISLKNFQRSANLHFKRSKSVSIEFGMRKVEVLANETQTPVGKPRGKDDIAFCY
jgi:hypothetical protein